MSTRRVAWFHCFAGIAGDMAVACLLDAGADESELRKVLASLPLSGWSMEVSRVTRGGLAATRVEVRADQDGGVSRTLGDVLEIVRGAALAPRVLARSIAAFTLLAETEGRIHGRRADEVHFHELGAHDTIVDVVATMTALELLDVDDVAASAVATGDGTITSAHGILPNPAPAVLGILAAAPVYGRHVAEELTTPTGAAVLVAAGARFGPLPAMVIESTGYGAGAREIEGLPNCTQVVLGTRSVGGAGGACGGDPAGQPLLLLETNVDDATGEEIADAIAALLDAGAADAWATPALMKKGRPGLVVSALADTALVTELRDVMLVHTGTLGVRAQVVDRYASGRALEEVVVDGESVRVKVSRTRVKVEHDDAARIARRTGEPVREVVRRAEEAYRSGAPAQPATPSSS